jgi:hypothetical protein
MGNVTRLPNGNLQVPIGAYQKDLDADGQEEIGPDDPDFQKWLRIWRIDEGLPAEEGTT